MPKYRKSPTIHATPFLPRHTRMPSRRRFRAIMILAAVAIICTLIYTSFLRQASGTDAHSVGDFYYKTKNALDTKKSEDKSGKSKEDQEVSRQMSERLKEAAQVAKDNANAKAPKPDPPSDVIGVGSAAGGAKSEKALGGRKKAGVDSDSSTTEESKVHHEVETELNSILKKAPIIIFSKSYCHHSKRAKGILLEKYIIDPKPFVVELDQHPLGLNLQGRLEELTGRRTVPNVLINGKSIGGGDDVAALDDTNKLIAKIKELGGKKMREVRAISKKDRKH